MKKVVETPEWGEYIASNTLTPTVIYGEDFRTFLENTKNGFEVVLTLGRRDRLIRRR